MSEADSLTNHEADVLERVYQRALERRSVKLLLQYMLSRYPGELPETVAARSDGR